MSDYSSNFPQQRPKLNLVFNSGSDKLDSRLSYSRSSSGTYMSSEKALNSENLVPYSNLSSGFTFGRTTLASTNNSAPDGGSDAASILETAVSGSHEVYDTFASVSGQQYSFVFYLKANGRTKVIFKPQATSVIANVTFDLTAVTSTVTSGSADSHSITAIGSTGWYKCAATVTATATGTGYTQFNLVDGTGASTYTGEISKGVFAWAASVSSTGQTVVNQTSGSIHREYSPLLKTASADSPRFEYSPATDGQSEGLLIEAQATNLQAYSSDFTSWSGQNRVTTTANVAIAPNGLLEADIVIANTSSTQSHNLSNTSTLASGTTYTASVYAKDAGQRYIQLSGSTGIFGSSQYATFDLQTGSVDANGVTASAVSVGNGWYRIQATMTATSSGSGGATIGLADSATASRLPLFAGNEYDGIILYGYQLEAAASASSLISTSGAAATKSADSCSVALSETNYSGGEGSLVVDLSINGRASGIGAVISDGSTENYYQVGQFATSLTYILYSELNNSVQANITQAETSNGSKKLAASWDTNDISACMDGGTVTTDTTNAFPLLTDLDIGSNPTGAAVLNGHIKRLSLFNVALSDVELQSLTSS